MGVPARIADRLQVELHLFYEFAHFGKKPLFAEVARKQSELVRDLPSTYEYLRRLHGKASQRPVPTSTVMAMHGNADNEELATGGTRAKP